MHHSDEFGENFPKRRKIKLYIRYLSSYSPEPNPIETVRKFIKQYRLTIPAYLPYEKSVRTYAKRYFLFTEL